MHIDGETCIILRKRVGKRHRGCILRRYRQRQRHIFLYRPIRISDRPALRIIIGLPQCLFRLFHGKVAGDNEADHDNDQNTKNGSDHAAHDIRSQEFLCRFPKGVPLHFKTSIPQYRITAPTILFAAANTGVSNRLRTRFSSRRMERCCGQCFSQAPHSTQSPA